MSLDEEMEATFKIMPSAWADGLFFLAGHLKIDPFKFEDFLKRRHGYDATGDDFESIDAFVLRTFGAEAVELIHRAIKGEAMRPATPWMADGSETK